MKVNLLQNGIEICLAVIEHIQVPFYPEPEDTWPFDCEEMPPIYVSDVMYLEHNPYGVFAVQDNIALNDQLRPIYNVKFLNKYDND